VPLSGHEQRILEEIENALAVEDPKLVSNVGRLGRRATTIRRRIGGAALFAVGLTTFIGGLAASAVVIGGFPILPILGFLVMYGGAVLAVCRPRVPWPPTDGG
jgi:hypothetical protein